MRKCVFAWPLAAEISWERGNFHLATLNFSLYVINTEEISNHMTQIAHSSDHFNPLKGIFSENLLIIMEF